MSNKTANVATPIVRDNLVFFSSAYGTGCALLRLESAGGSTTASEVYFSQDMKNHYSSSVLLDDHLYGFSGRILTAMNFETGEVTWQDRSVGKGQMILADGRLYILSDDGVVGLVEPDPGEYREISRFEIGRWCLPTWTLPVIADGTLYCATRPGSTLQRQVRKGMDNLVCAQVVHRIRLAGSWPAPTYPISNDHRPRQDFASPVQPVFP